MSGRYWSSLTPTASMRLRSKPCVRSTPRAWKSGSRPPSKQSGRSRRGGPVHAGGPGPARDRAPGHADAQRPRRQYRRLRHPHQRRAPFRAPLFHMDARLRLPPPARKPRRFRLRWRKSRARSWSTSPSPWRRRAEAGERGRGSTRAAEPFLTILSNIEAGGPDTPNPPRGIIATGPAIFSIIRSRRAFPPRNAEGRELSLGSVSSLQGVRNVKSEMASTAKSAFCKG
jgi:hypothetical protein